MNTLLLAVLNQIIALQNRVALNLVGSGHDSSAVNDGLKLLEAVSTGFRSSVGKGNEREE